jgi:ferredoxin
MPSDFEIVFEDDPLHSAPVKVIEGICLSTALDVENSPVLFGCRTGICGTCLIEVLEQKEGLLPPPDAIEAESLDLYAPTNSKARLACQLTACASLRVRKIQAE